MHDGNRVSRLEPATSLVEAVIDVSDDAQVLKLDQRLIEPASNDDDPVIEHRTQRQASSVCSSITEVTKDTEKPAQQIITRKVSDVDEIVSAEDNPELPVNTFRAWTLGLLFSIIGAGINNFFAERLPGIAISSFVAQLVAYPAGKLMERSLPIRRFTTFGKEWSLNPGPFSPKEQMLITIMASVSFGSAYATSIIITQRLPIFYNQQWASNWAYQLLLVMSTQIIGYGLAGISRRFLVYPAAAVWPSTLAVVALNKSFHENRNDVVSGMTIRTICILLIVQVGV